MWPQIIASLIPMITLALPLLGFTIQKSWTAKSAPAQLEPGPRAKGGAIARAAASVAVAAANDGDSSSQPKSAAKSWTDQGSKLFADAIQSIERRAMENSDHNIYGYLSGLLEEIRLLQSKLELSAVDQQARLTYAKYAPMLKKIEELTSPSSYGDFIRNPTHWNDPKRMRVQVELSVLAVAKEVSEDIRRLNSFQELNFQVSVESLIGKAAASAESKNPDAALEELLSAPSDGINGIHGDLDNLKGALISEAAELEQRQAKEKLAQDEEEAKLRIERFKAGSKRNLEIQNQGPRPVLISKELRQQSYTIYGPGGNDSKFLVFYLNKITGKSDWQEFASAFAAADWVDRAIVAEEEKHGFKCDCVYCRS